MLVAIINYTCPFCLVKDEKIKSKGDWGIYSSVIYMSYNCLQLWKVKGAPGSVLNSFCIHLAFAYMNTKETQLSASLWFSSPSCCSNLISFPFLLLFFFLIYFFPVMWKELVKILLFFLQEQVWWQWKQPHMQANGTIWGIISSGVECLTSGAWQILLQHY